MTNPGQEKTDQQRQAGVGINFVTDDTGALEVHSLVPDGPAERAGATGPDTVILVAKHY